MPAREAAEMAEAAADTGRLAGGGGDGCWRCCWCFADVGNAGAGACAAVSRHKLAIPRRAHTFPFCASVSHGDRGFHALAVDHGEGAVEVLVSGTAWRRRMTEQGWHASCFRE